MPSRGDDRNVQRSNLSLQELQINRLVDIVVEDKLRISALEGRIERLEREIVAITRNMPRRGQSHDYAESDHEHSYAKKRHTH